jgi:hypothetical protein
MEPDLHVAHRPKLIPTSPKQRRHHSSLSDGLGGIMTVFQGIPVAPGRTDPISAAVKPAASPPRHNR